MTGNLSARLRRLEQGARNTNTGPVGLLFRGSKPTAEDENHARRQIERARANGASVVFVCNLVGYRL
jgi:hypothetical protein